MKATIIISTLIALIVGAYYFSMGYAHGKDLVKDFVPAQGYTYEKKIYER